MSRVRVGYVIKDKTKKSLLTGGNNSAYNANELYNQGIEMLYTGGKNGKTQKRIAKPLGKGNNKNITLKKRKMIRKTRKLKLNKNKNKNKNRKTLKKNKNKNKNRYSKRK